MNERLVSRTRRFGWWVCAVVISLNSSSGRAQPAGLASVPKSPAYEVATIKPVKVPNPNNMHDRTEGRRLSMHNTSVRDLMMMAYQVDPRQIAGGPAWLASDEYDIDAVTSDGVTIDDQREEAILQELLADRFGLKFHREQRMMNVYVLEVAKGGPRLKTADADGTENSGCEHLGVCSFRKRSLANFARFMQFVVLDRPVMDKTGIEGTFDFTLKWTPDESQFRNMGFQAPPLPEETTALPGLFTAIQEQLGLKLEPQKIPAEVLVIDHADRPSEN